MEARSDLGFKGVEFAAHSCGFAQTGAIDSRLCGGSMRSVTITPEQTN